ncbi:MAG TPA: endonuclease/exonuclease/phosphatase family protein, partial [Deltaproteobacteria bacterium]|nr:endonuclease/exonuclease/phosphatase family protein [Deltaproteobacteria bacterium]
MKIVTWNINRASYTRKNFWERFNKLDFDVGLFQEVYMIPFSVRKKYHIIRGEMNAILVKKTLNIEPKEESIISNNNSETDAIVDFYVSAKMELTGKRLVFISVYNYIGPNENEFSEFLDIMLSYIRNNKEQITIIGGDFNIDEKFGGNYKG